MSDRPAALPGNLPQSAAQSTVRRALALAAEKYAATGLSVAVCDRNGFLLAFGRTDNARPLSIELSIRKAYTASRMACSTLAFQQRLQRENLELAYFSDERLAAMPGGIPVFNDARRLIGAIAIGGISAQEDVVAAERLVAALGEELAGHAAE